MILFPVLWRYLLSNYLKTFTLSILAFISLLLTMKMEEIAYIATLGSSFFDVLWFTLHQIPYLIPIAMPISSLIAAYVLIHTLSRSHELTALRACNLSFQAIMTPILLISIFFSVFNFYMVSELASSAHHSIEKIKDQLKSVNPLLLLHNKHLMQSKGIYFDVFGKSKLGEYAEDVVIITPGRSEERASLFLAKKLNASAKNLIAEGTTLIKEHVHSSKGSLAIENMAKATMASDVSKILGKSNQTDEERKISVGHMSFLELLVYKATKENRSSGYVEILRRLSVSLSVITFTYLGLSFGITISRNPSFKGIATVIILATLYLVCFFAAKGYDKKVSIAAILYLMPQILIVVVSFLQVNKMTKGLTR